MVSLCLFLALSNGFDDDVSQLCDANFQALAGTTGCGWQQSTLDDKGNLLDDQCEAQGRADCLEIWRRKEKRHNVQHENRVLEHCTMRFQAKGRHESYFQAIEISMRPLTRSAMHQNLAIESEGLVLQLHVR